MKNKGRKYLSIVLILLMITPTGIIVATASQSHSTQQGIIQGRVFSDSNGNPLVGVTISINGYKDTTNTNGYYRVIVKPDTYAITVNKAGYKTITVNNVQVNSGETITKNFQLSLNGGSGTIIGFVYDSETKDGIKEANVKLENANNSYSCKTMKYGVQVGMYKFDDVPLGTYRITISKNGYYTTTLEDVVVTLGEEVHPPDAYLAPVSNDAHIQGIIKDNYNTPLRGATVSTDGDSQVTDYTGHYYLTVDPGSHTVTVSKNGFQTEHAVVSVSAGQTENKNFQLVPAGGSNGYIIGVVQNKNTSQPIGGATVYTTGASTITNNQGEYKLVVKAGNNNGYGYYIHAKASGYYTTYEHISWVGGGENQTVTVNLNLTPLPNQDPVNDNDEDNNDSKDDPLAPPTTLGGGIDQSQDDTNGGYVKIYGDNYYAQSFVPQEYAQLTGISICIEKNTKSFENNNEDAGSNIGADTSPPVSLHSASKKLLSIFDIFLEKIKDIFSKMSSGGKNSGSPLIQIISSIVNKSRGQTGSYSSSNGNTTNGGLTDWNGALVISVKDSLNGAYLAQRTIEPKDIPKNKEWIAFDFSSHDWDLEIGKEYYFVVYQYGGSEDNYYKWYYGSGNCYQNGDAFYSENSGAEWQGLNDDFAFETYGEYNGREPDGVTTRWALLVAYSEYENNWAHPFGEIGKQDAYRIEDALKNDSFDWGIETLIDSQATKSRIISDIDDLFRNKADQDDLVFLSFSSHGAPDGSIATYKHGQWLETNDIRYTLGVGTSVVININACYSGSFIPGLKGDGRVIITSSSADNKSSGGDEDWGCSPHISLLVEALSGKYLRTWEGRGKIIPSDKDADYNNDGYVSAEEAYKYIYINHYKEPCISDGYPTLADNSDELILTQPIK